MGKPKLPEGISMPKFEGNRAERRRRERDWLKSVGLRPAFHLTVTESSSSLEDDSRSNISVPQKKPDYPLFLGIIGVLGMVFIFALQANDVEMNWMISAALYVLCAIGILLSVYFHAVPHLQPWMRRVAGIIAFVCAIGLGAFGTTKQYRKEHSPTTSIAPVYDPNHGTRIAATLTPGEEEGKHLPISGIAIVLQNLGSEPDHNIYSRFFFPSAVRKVETDIPARVQVSGGPNWRGPGGDRAIELFAPQLDSGESRIINVSFDPVASGDVSATLRSDHCGKDCKAVFIIRPEMDFHERVQSINPALYPAITDNITLTSEYDFATFLAKCNVPCQFNKGVVVGSDSEIAPLPRGKDPTIAGARIVEPTRLKKGQKIILEYMAMNGGPLSLIWTGRAAPAKKEGAGRPCPGGHVHIGEMVLNGVTTGIATHGDVCVSVDKETMTNGKTALDANARQETSAPSRPPQ